MTSVGTALRSLRRHPGYTMAAVATIALAIGINTSVFSFLNAVALRSLPYGEADRLYDLHSVQRGGVALYASSSLADVRDWQAEAQGFAAIGAAAEFGVNVRLGDDVERVHAARVTTNLFDVLQVRPALGRGFSDADADAAVVIVSDRFWRDRLGADPAVLGSWLVINGEPRVVVGVMPRGIGYPDFSQLWVPLGSVAGRDRSVRDVRAIGRLADGVSARAAALELDEIASRLAAAYPATNEGWSVFAASTVAAAQNELDGVFGALLGAVVCVLLIACANVANLSLARGTRRRQEIAVRYALGASRVRVLWPLLLESGLVAAAGGALGFLLALWGRDAMVALLPVAEIPAWIDFGFDARVLGFTLGATLLAALLALMLPAWIVTRRGIAAVTRAGSHTVVSGGRGRNGLVVAETALACTLLLGAALMLRSASNVTRADLGYDADRLVSLMIAGPPAAGDVPRPGASDAARAAAAAGQAGAGRAAAFAARAAAIGGVEQVAFSAGVPADRRGGPDAYPRGGAVTAAEGDSRADGRSAVPAPAAGLFQYAAVSPDFLATLGLPIRAGRGLLPSDATGAPVAVVSEEAARRLWREAGSVIGRQIALGSAPGHGPWLTVVGVAGDRARAGIPASGASVGGAPAQPVADVWLPAADFAGGFEIVVRVAPGSDVGVTGAAVRRELAALDAAADIGLPVGYAQRHGDNSRSLRWLARLFAGFAATALLLAALGLYSVLAYNVAQRTREIGVRMAVGARAGDVIGMIVANGVRLAALGVGIGLLGGAGIGQLLGSLLFGLRPIDPVTYASVAAVLLGVAVLASGLPARRAARLDPLVSLRPE